MSKATVAEQQKLHDRWTERERERERERDEVDTERGMWKDV